MIIVPETLIIMNNLTQYLLTLMFIPQVGRNLPGCPGHDLLPAPGALAQCGGRAHEGNIFPIKLFSNIYMYPYILLSLRYLEALPDDCGRKVGLHCDSRLAKPTGIGNGSNTTTSLIYIVPGS